MDSFLTYFESTSMEVMLRFSQWKDEFDEPTRLANWKIYRPLGLRKRRRANSKAFNVLVADAGKFEDNVLAAERFILDHRDVIVFMRDASSESEGPELDFGVGDEELVAVTSHRLQPGFMSICAELSITVCISIYH